MYYEIIITLSYRTVEQKHYIVGKHIILLNSIHSKVSILGIIYKNSIKSVQNPVFICL